MAYRVCTSLHIEHEMTFDDEEEIEVMKEMALMEARKEGEITSRIQSVYSEPAADK